MIAGVESGTIEIAAGPARPEQMDAQVLPPTVIEQHHQRFMPMGAPAAEKLPDLAEASWAHLTAIAEWRI